MSVETDPSKTSSTSSSSSFSSNPNNDKIIPLEPPVTKDARFRAGRKLIQSGKGGENAIQLFATLVEESRMQYGLEAIETSSSYYEYGNALFRAYVRQESVNDSNNNLDSKKEEPSKASRLPSRSKLAEAAEKRFLTTLPKQEDLDTSKSKNDAPSTKKSSDPLLPLSSSSLTIATPSEPMHEDIALALEMMETAFSILDHYLSTRTPITTNPNSDSNYIQWSQIQIPRVLCGIGDVFSFLQRHADAADAYIRAIPYREQLLQSHTSKPTTSTTASTNDSTITSILSLDHLKARRLFVEVHVLISEELLAHPSDLDVISTPTPILLSQINATNNTTSNTPSTSDQSDSEMKPILLVKASERIEFAKGYYEKAREELQETVFLMGKIAARGIDLETEKEDVCFLATILMGVGNTLADLEDEDSSMPRKKAKLGLK